MIESLYSNLRYALDNGFVQHLFNLSFLNKQNKQTEVDYLEWFAEQRKHLIIARAELEQMKRDGFRPTAVGGDLDPYAAVKPGLTFDQQLAKRRSLLATARQERVALEVSKQEAAKALFETKKQEYRRLLNNQDTSFAEVVIKTKELGKIVPGSRKMYLERRLTEVVPIPFDDDDTVAQEGQSEVRSVFGEAGQHLYGASTRKVDYDQRLDNIKPVDTPVGSESIDQSTTSKKD